MSEIPFEVLENIIIQGGVAGAMTRDRILGATNFLLAFAPYKELSYIIKKATKGRNFVLTIVNAATFRNLRNPEQGRIQGLTISLTDADKDDSLPLGACISFGFNNLSSIHVDLTLQTATRSKDYDLPPPGWVYETGLRCQRFILYWLILASVPGVKKLVVILRSG
ncbi:hypothetical protein VTL71DRAFT_3258 [Oculimacula yallundae]|uniref:Uncharacterized protein n=1 Tax=Oculimacula yallundae TaxID=86028 RepID=A0ABR4C8T9_9HELO